VERLAGTIPTVRDHLSIQCADLAASSVFYDAVLSPLGGERVIEIGAVIGYGVAGRPSFWLGPLAGEAPNREAHIAFRATDRSAVRAFYDAGVVMGAEALHEPRLWPEYHSNYFGAFLRDPDGNNVEAVCHSPE
jgi:catechol 2,3-dioxygenase-like lactoylglutathione lyase family enzyme